MTEPTDEARAWAEQVMPKIDAMDDCAHGRPTCGPCMNCMMVALASEVLPIMRERDEALAGIVEIGMELAHEHEKLLAAEKRARRAEEERDKLREIADALAEGLKVMIQEFAGPHAIGCPEDDTCECMRVEQIETALARYEAAKKDRNQPLTPKSST